MKERNLLIDYIKGLGIVVIILTHSLVPYLTNKTIHLFWDLIHFAVVAFVFCAGYLFYSRIKPDYFSFGSLTKRLKRIIVPYLIYALCFIAIIFLIEKPFSPQALKTTILNLGLYDINWFVILFVYLTFIMPVIQFLFTKCKPLWIVYFICSIAAASYFTFYRLHIDYKYTMWLAWSLCMFLSQLFVMSKDKNQWMRRLSITFGIIFAVVLTIKLQLHQNTSLFNNKYPPGFLYLSYGLAILGISYHLLNRKFSDSVNEAATFLSSQSYSLFFVHLLVIYVCNLWKLPPLFPWPIFFLLVLAISVLLVVGWQWAHYRLHKT